VIIVGGEALIDLIVSTTGEFSPVPGGGPYNTARTIARLGGEVRFLGHIADDWFGRRLRSALEADGVDMALVVPTAAPTTLVLAEIDAAGVAHYHWYLKGTSAPGLSVEEARRALSPTPAAIHVGTLGLILEPVADSLAALVAEAPADAFVMVDVNCRPNATADPPRYRERMTRVLGRADVVKASVEDLEFYDPERSPDEAARRIRELGAAAVLVTHGSGPVTVHHADGSFQVPVPAVPVVDTVGAGDAFGGGFLSRWLEQGLGREHLAQRDRLEEAAAFAVRVAALTCERAGADPPTRADLAERSWA
jgi:fructokinase